MMLLSVGRWFSVLAACKEGYLLSLPACLACIDLEWATCLHCRLHDSQCPLTHPLAPACSLNWMPTYFYKVLGACSQLCSPAYGSCCCFCTANLLASPPAAWQSPSLPCCPPHHTLLLRCAGVDLRSSALLSFIPWLAMAAGSSAAGLLADGLVRAGHNVTAVRKWVQVRSGPVAAGAPCITFMWVIFYYKQERRSHLHISPSTAPTHQ